MGEFWASFEKLGNDLKLQVSLILFGFIMPSLIYYVILFTNEFIQIDLIKLSIICICTNFLFIASFTSIGIVLKAIIFYKNKDLMTSYGDCLSNKSTSQSNNLIILREKETDIIERKNVADKLNKELISLSNSNEEVDYSKIKEKEKEVELKLDEIEHLDIKLTEMINEHEIINEKLGKQIKQLDNHIKQITDIPSQLAVSSTYYSISMIILTVMKMIITKGIGLVLDLDIIFRESIILIAAVVISQMLISYSKQKNDMEGLKHILE